MEFLEISLCIENTWFLIHAENGVISPAPCIPAHACICVSVWVLLVCVLRFSPAFVCWWERLIWTECLKVFKEGWENKAKIKVVPLLLVPCRVCVWEYVSVRASTDSSARPSRCWQDPPLHLVTPSTNPIFSTYVCVCVSDIKVIDSQTVTRVIGSSCGKRGTSPPPIVLSPEGERES